MLGEILNKILLSEQITTSRLDKAMDGHRYVAFNYNSTNGQGLNTGRRYVIPFAYGVTKAGNPVLRAFQIKGDTTTDNLRWKFFRLDRIENFRTSQKQFTQEDLEQYWQYGEANYEGDETMAGKPQKIVSFRSQPTSTPNDTQPSGAMMQNGQSSGPKMTEPTDALAQDDSKQSGPKMRPQKEYKPGDIIPYKEFMRRNVDLRFGGRKSNLTKLANDLFKAGKLNYDDEEEENVPETPQIEEPKQETPTLGQIAGWNTDTITAKDQVNDRFSKLRQQLQNQPQTIDLSQFDKYEPTTNKKRW